MEENKKGGKGNHEEFMLELKKFRIEKGSLTTVYILLEFLMQNSGEQCTNLYYVYMNKITDLHN